MTTSSDSNAAAPVASPVAPPAPAPDDEGPSATRVGIRLVDVDLDFRKYGDNAPSLKQTVLNRILRRQYTNTQRFPIYQGLNLSIGPGERVGVIGHNGAGKTTLLRLVAGIYHPTRGRVTVAGRLASLVGMGVGSNPELSGAENVLMMGLVQGRSIEHMRERLPAIIDFAGLHEFAQTPMKYYSTGMAVRLSFSVATDRAADILLADEIFSGGDQEFRTKASARMKALMDSAQVLMFVSHSMELIRMLTRRCLWIDHGQIRMDGPTPEVVAAYLASVKKK